MSIYEFDEKREMRLIREDGREIGREADMALGEQRILMLNKVLLEDNRFDDLKSAVDDEAYRATLCKEYSI